ncbi:MAG: ATP-grasp domain-containing protein [Spirochaetales bacterium]
MKHVLILGAGLMQKPAIDAARELGCVVTVLDGNADAFCKSEADRFEVIDLKDTQAIVDFAVELHREKPLSGVFTAGTDFSYAVACVADACNLPGHTPQAAKNASDKLLMRSCFQKHGVPSPQFAEVCAGDDILSFLKTMPLPLVVKPCDNMGSRGCRLVRSADELQSAVDDALFYSKTGRAIIEQYMDGPEFSIDSLVFNGELTVTGFADRHIFYPPYFIEMGHTMPTSADHDTCVDLLKTFYEGIKSLGLTYGAAKADIKFTSQGSMIGEIAARLSGGYMSGWTYPYASGLNLTKQALLLALGENPPELIQRRTAISIDVSAQQKPACKIYDVACNAFSAERAWLSIPGKIQSVDFWQKAQSMPYVKAFFRRIHAGDTAVFPVNNVEKAGNVISYAKTRDEACSGASDAAKTVFLRLESHNGETDAFLCQALDTPFPPSAFALPRHIVECIEALPKKQTAIFGKKITVPGFLQDVLHLKDWNGRTLAESFAVYVSLTENFENIEKCDNHICADTGLPNFWHCFIRGGIQGALYYADTLMKG